MPLNPRPFLTAEWRNLAVLNFEVTPALLESHLPAGTELDLWEGKALVSVVGFQFLHTKVLGVSIPLHRNFYEVNLRFYVRGAQGRGVVFLKEIVPRRAVTGVANLFYGEKYVTAPIAYAFSQKGGLLTVSYSWQWNGKRNFIDVSTAGELKVPEEGSPEAFIFEHYWGYTRLRGGRSSAYRVEHPPWRVWSAANGTCTIDGDGLYGSGFGDALSAKPLSAMLAEGSAVSVFRGQRSTA